MKSKQAAKKAPTKRKTPEKSPRNLRTSARNSKDSSDEQGQCGMCNRNLTKQAMMDNVAFIKNCVLCSSHWYNHPTCAKKILLCKLRNVSR